MARHCAEIYGRIASVIGLSRDALSRGDLCTAAEQRTRAFHGMGFRGLREAIDECSECLAIFGSGTLVAAQLDERDQLEPWRLLRECLFDRFPDRGNGGLRLPARPGN